MYKAMAVSLPVSERMQPPDHRRGKPAGRLWQTWRDLRPSGILSPSWLNTSVAMLMGMWCQFKPLGAPSVPLRPTMCSPGAGALTCLDVAEGLTHKLSSRRSHAGANLSVCQCCKAPTIALRSSSSAVLRLSGRRLPTFDYGTDWPQDSLTAAEHPPSPFYNEAPAPCIKVPPLPHPSSGVAHENNFLDYAEEACQYRPT